MTKIYWLRLTASGIRSELYSLTKGLVAICSRRGSEAKLAFWFARHFDGEREIEVAADAMRCLNDSSPSIWMVGGVSSNWNSIFVQPSFKERSGPPLSPFLPSEPPPMGISRAGLSGPG